MVEALLAVQSVELQNRTLTAAEESECRRIRATVPASILQKFDRLVRRGKRAVAIVRNGVCSECHLRLPSGTLAGLAYTAESHYCDNCTRLLYLPEDEPLGVTMGAREVSQPSAPPRARRPRRRKPVHRV